MSEIRLEKLTKRFGDFTAIEKMDLQVRNGEFLALLGPSGCGKSTTMNIIAGMESPSEGTVYFGDRDVTRVPMGKRGVGFVFQNYAIFTHMTVRQNLEYGLRMHGLPAAQRKRKVDEIAGFLELSPLLDKPTAGLSVNILQRIAIGRSAVLEPAIFLLDEPLSNVDAAFRSVMRYELKQLQRRFRQTMVYVTHDQLEAMTMADRIAVMDQGVLQQVGTPLEVYNNPANIFVANFIGSPGMNLLKGALTSRDGRPAIAFEELDQTIELPDELARLAEKRNSAAVLYGFRPEEIELTSQNGLSMKADFLERIGARTILHLEASGREVKAVFDNNVAVQLDSMVSFRPASGSERLFDAQTGARIG
ncbi:ABC transporter ATP-binding protein [Pseudohoeflea coraliihabitans]|uniref:ABC transporter ATP-binding protein n=1 Tax=Pseudohoeflea coraliihabitans TaxID=2860393 RepID=A0ABS6WJ77_9HYPH|nr:ABC transporter ATP-binding protein [Pseudohoeflea sp. DP4N28-3]MBW3095989.1 ABC transporter ATP-binding protein [Pseudohoeflea sp. DP4N28-3]